MKETIDYSYIDLLSHIMATGYDLPPAERQGVGTRQITAYQLEYDLREGFPLLTTKKMYWKGIFVELEWFIKGLTNIRWLRERDCKIWDADAYKYYVRLFKKIYPNEEPSKFEDFLISVDKGHESVSLEHQDGTQYYYGDMGPIYGAMWRDYPFLQVIEDNSDGLDKIFGTGKGEFEYCHVDQLQRMVLRITDAIKANYNDRRIIVDAWHPFLSEKAALPPCHKSFQVILEPISYEERIGLYNQIPRNQKASLCQFNLTQEEDMEDMDRNNVPRYYLNLVWDQRSVDTFLGLPFNIASYAALTHILAKLTHTVPKSLIGQLKAVHIYDNHFKQVAEQLERNPLTPPEIEFNEEFTTIDEFRYDMIQIVDYECHQPIKAQMNS